jgi:uncharacterized membrane protein YdjX (TVP38/TMEM64 family)
MGMAGAAGRVALMGQVNHERVPEVSMTSSLLKLLIFGLPIAFGLGFLVTSGFDMERLLESIRATDPFLFLGIMSLLPLAGFPIAAFYLYAGSAFPWWQASLLCSLALALNISIAFPIAKYLLAGPVTHILERYRKSIPPLTRKNQFRVTFLVRSIPGIPYFMQNYLLALVGVKFTHYFLISWLVQSVFAAGMAAVPHLIEKTGWITGGILLALAGILLVLHRAYSTDPWRNIATERENQLLDE